MIPLGRRYASLSVCSAPVREELNLGDIPRAPRRMGCAPAILPSTLLIQCDRQLVHVYCEVSG